MKKNIVRVLMCTMLLGGLSGCSGTPEETTEAVATVEETTTAETTTVEETEESEAETEAETEKATKKANTGVKPDFGPLSDELYSFQIQVNDDVYQLPMTYEDFVSFGWEYKGNEEDMLDSNFRSGSERFFLGDLECYVNIVNFDINARPLKECYIGGIKFDEFMLKKAEGTTITFPGGIEFNTSSADDARAKYGTPSYENTTNNGTEILEYKKDYYQEYKLRFDGETKKIIDMEVKNFDKPDDFATGEVSTEIPEIVTKYQAPAALSDDLSQFVVDYAGKLYQLPAPVSEFEADGWVIQEDNSVDIVEGRGSGWITLMKDNQKLKIIVTNYSEGATQASNCFVTDVKADKNDTKVDLNIGLGIGIGMTQSALEEAIEGVSYETEESASYTYFTLMPTGSKVDRYDVIVEKESNLVFKIEAKYQPKYSEYTSR